MRQKKKMRDYAKTIEDLPKKLADAVRYASWGEWKGEQEIRMSVDELIEELIRNIRKRLPRYCVECEEWYRSEPNTEKVAECLICQVGIHGCKNVERRLKEGLRNSTWICKECNDTLHGEDERILKRVRRNVKTTTVKVTKTRPIRERRRSSSLDEANRGDERERTSGTGTESGRAERNSNVDADTDGRENGKEMEGSGLQQGKETELVVERVGMMWIEGRGVK